MAIIRILAPRRIQWSACSIIRPLPSCTTISQVPEPRAGRRPWWTNRFLRRPPNIRRGSTSIARQSALTDELGHGTHVAGIISGQIPKGAVQLPIPNASGIPVGPGPKEGEIGYAVFEQVFKADSEGERESSGKTPTRRDVRQGRRDSWSGARVSARQPQGHRAHRGRVA